MRPVTVIWYMVLLSVVKNKFFCETHVHQKYFAGKTTIAQSLMMVHAGKRDVMRYSSCGMESCQVIWLNNHFVVFNQVQGVL